MTIELAGLNERSDGRPVLCRCVMYCEKSMLPIKRYRADGSLDSVVVDVDTTAVRKTQSPSQYLAPHLVARTN